MQRFATLEVRGADKAAARILRLSDFQKLTRIPLSAGLGVAKREFASTVGSRKAARAMKVRVVKDAKGLTGRVGPVGGKHRPGYLAALFLEKGTGVHGPKRRRIVPKNGEAFAFYSQRVTTARFGPSAQLFTKSGRVRSSAATKFGGAAQVVVRSTAGAPAKPWFDRSVRASRGRVSEEFRRKLHEVIASGR